MFYKPSHVLYKNNVIESSLKSYNRNRDGYEQMKKLKLREAVASAVSSPS